MPRLELGKKVWIGERRGELVLVWSGVARHGKLRGFPFADAAKAERDLARRVNAKLEEGFAVVDAGATVPARVEATKAGVPAPEDCAPLLERELERAGASPDRPAPEAVLRALSAFGAIRVRAARSGWWFEAGEVTRSRPSDAESAEQNPQRVYQVTLARELVPLRGGLHRVGVILLGDLSGVRDPPADDWPMPKGPVQAFIEQATETDCWAAFTRMRPISYEVVDALLD